VLADPHKKAIYDTTGVKGLQTDGWEVTKFLLYWNVILEILCCKQYSCIRIVSVYMSIVHLCRLHCLHSWLMHKLFMRPFVLRSGDLKSALWPLSQNATNKVLICT
jgi:hypothetical protein